MAGEQGIVAALRARIRSGGYGAGSRLPTVRALAEEFSLSLPTVSRALGELVEQGFISTDGRRGTRVVDFPPHRHRFGLVLPVMPGDDGSYANLHWRALALAAATFADPRRTIEVFHGVGPHAELAAHLRLRAALADGRLAGLMVPDPQAISAWFDIRACGVPVVSGGGHGHLRLPHLGDVHPDQSTFTDQAFDRIRARGLSRCALLVNHYAADFALGGHAVEAARVRGLDLPRHRIQGIAVDRAEWAWNTVSALWSDPHPPEALVIADDHLVPAATRALAEAGAGAFVVAQANFPVEAPSAVPCVRLGWDQRAYLDLAIDRIDSHLGSGVAIGDHHLPLVSKECP